MSVPTDLPVHVVVNLFANIFGYFLAQTMYSHATL